MEDVVTIEEIQQEIVGEFSLFADWMEKYEHLIELGKELPLISGEYRVEANLVKGCQSRVWLHAELKDGIVVYSADSDAIITKGLIALLIRVLSNHTPVEIAQAELSFINEIGLQDHLSPTRANGLLSMLKQMKFYALAFQAQKG